VIRRQAAGQAAVSGPGDAAALKQPGQAYQGRSESACVRMVSFEASLLDQVADGLGLTPLGYLRQVRLGRAHRDLLAGGPAGPAVTAVSARWGFSSSSRFAVYHREAFGVPPGCTRNRAG
jgi:methylphosphotriester-DNA--protein-cysteine methyltransferase